MSFTQWLTMSWPTVSWTPARIATFVFVPTLSVDETSTGSFRREKSGRNMPPKEPISESTPALKVPRARRLMRSLASSAAEMSTPASR